MKKIPKRAWQKLSAGAGAGAKGHRHYDWALAVIADGRPGHRHLPLATTAAPANSPTTAATRPPRPPDHLRYGCRRRWTIEETFQSSKTLAGLDEHQVRRWTSWHRWVTLAMLAHAFLAAVTAAEQTQHKLIPLTRNEIQHLFTTLVTQPRHTTGHRLRCSHWRRRHQGMAGARHPLRQDPYQPPCRTPPARRGRLAPQPPMKI